MFWKQELAVSATISKDTGTNIAVVSLMAGGTIVARVMLTTADWRTAVAACISWWACAGVTVRTLLARATILARIDCALVSCVVTVHTSETVWTLTQVRVDQINAVRT